MNALYPALASLILFGAVSAPTVAAAESEPARSITVNGVGEAAARPDMAMITIGVRSEGPTASEALAANNRDMSATLKSLKDAGVKDRDVQTSGLSINPKYDYERNRSEPEVIGFVASNTVTVRLRDIDKAGDVIDQAVRSGANSLGGVSFGFDDPKPLQNAALKNAVASARAKAELLTQAAGVDLGPVMTINESYSGGPTPRPLMARAESVASDVAIEAGESTISAQVTIVYAIE